MARVAIRNSYGLIIGYIETQPNGDKKVRNASGQILGYYKKNQDVTTDEYGRILYHGDMLTSLIK